MNYYNEIDPYCAQWLRNLIAAGHLPSGIVDDRDIRDINPDELKEFTQCHFFAGIGIWPFALQRAGWNDRYVWTGSCPCQPFSVTGKGSGFNDERHLWPAWKILIEKRRPPTVFGEQVANTANWLGLVRSDLEEMDYAVGACPIEAASAGAFHFRDRIFFVAHTARHGWNQEYANASWCVSRNKPQGQSTGFMSGSSHVFRLGLDGKCRAIEPGIEPLAHADPSFMGRLRAYGNAISVGAAVAFIKAAI